MHCRIDRPIILMNRVERGRQARSKPREELRSKGGFDGDLELKRIAIARNSHPGLRFNRYGSIESEPRWPNLKSVVERKEWGFKRIPIE